MSKIIKIQNLSKKFKDNYIFKDFNLELEKGEFLMLLGSSGIGKSTLLRMIGGFESVSGGKILLQEHELQEHEILAPRKDIFMLFQDFEQIFAWKSVLENVCYPMELENKFSKNEIKKQALNFLKLVGLENCVDYYPHELSGGMKQRVAIARALSAQPKVLLMDEPFGALDAYTRGLLCKKLYEIWQNAKGELSIIFVTHSIFEAISMASKFLVLENNFSFSLLDNLAKDGIRTPNDAGFNEIWQQLSEKIHS